MKFLIPILFFALFFLLMSVRLIFRKNGEFKGTCASQNPFLQKEGVNCSLCGKEAKQCPKDTEKN